MKNPIVIYDGICNLCIGIIKLLTRFDKKKILNIVPLQSEFVNEIMFELGLPQTKLDTVTVLYSGKIYVKSRAVFLIIKFLPGYFKILNIFKIVPPGFADKIYDFIALHRYQIFGRKIECELPAAISESADPIKNQKDDNM